MIMLYATKQTPMRKYDPQQPLIFTHIPKCAGTSIVRVLRHWFRGHYYHTFTDDRRGLPMQHVATRDATGQWDRNVQCIHAHFDHRRGYGLPYFYPEIQQYVTIFRDPFDIVVSMYFFAKGKAQAGKFFHEGNAIDFCSYYPNLETYVHEHPIWLYDHLPQDLTLYRLRESLAARFVYIGIFEDMATSIDCLRRKLGKPPIEMPLRNVSKYDEEVPESLRKWFYHNHPLLYEIYQFALETYRDT
ncbi:MAG: sulfotransferase family 2 domain-containing protein [Planctomycetaceae bacterium]|nr:sulfotransferase family 2 domain-containing protein [Planctomycetaceae bacterium]